MGVFQKTSRNPEKQVVGLARTACFSPTPLPEPFYVLWTSPQLRNIGLDVDLPKVTCYVLD